ncbi:hypothetical protein P20652_3633 [Pseudoalteromonas sp. BSi20652]|nr:hypothetical protein P20652_3633 [Pseudoalteromonas sp. BSi20652]
MGAKYSARFFKYFCWLTKKSICSVYKIKHWAIDLYMPYITGFNFLCIS